MPIAVSEDNPRIRDFLQQHPVGILATATPDGEPHAATIYFFTEDDFTIYFMTKQETTKNNNLVANPRVSLAVFDAPSQTTVQISGTVTKITDMEKAKHVLASMMDVARLTSSGHTPPLEKLDAGKYIAYGLQPSRIRMAEFVKAEYPPNDQLFEIVSPPEKL